MNKPSSYKPCLDKSNWAAACAVFGSALQQAAAMPHGLHLRSCKLFNVDWDCNSILQQLAVNSLTSLELQLNSISRYDLTESANELAGVLVTLPQLLQLRQLSLHVVEGSQAPVSQSYIEEVDPLLESLSGLTNLTSLEVGPLKSLRSESAAVCLKTVHEIEYGQQRRIGRRINTLVVPAA
jgi:hypothetical protein